jgi:hypothetical protein
LNKVTASQNDRQAFRAFAGVVFFVGAALSQVSVFDRYSI